MALYKRICAAAALIIMMLLLAAAECVADDGVRVILTDTTATNITTMAGEAKVKVSISGLSGDVTIAQLKLNFGGDLKYKSIKYLVGKDDPENGEYIISPNAAAVNSTKQISTGILSVRNPINFNGETDLFELTFTGNALDTVSLSLDIENSYIIIDDIEHKPGEIVGDKVIAASETGVDAVKARVVFTIQNEYSADYPLPADGTNTGMFVTLTDTVNQISYSTELNYIPISQGGTFDASASELSFVVELDVIAGVTYDINMSGEGFVMYNLKDVSFDDGEPVYVTGDDFYPLEVVKVSVSGKRAVFTMTARETRTITAYFAVYAADGTLTAVKAAKLTPGEKTVISLVDYNGSTYRAFAWDEFMTPVYMHEV